MAYVWEIYKSYHLLGEIVGTEEYVASVIASLGIDHYALCVWLHEAPL